MTKKTINELDDIGQTQEENALCAIEQNGATFKARVRPNPQHQINVSTQAQLITQFGSNLIIPDNEEFTIYVDESFGLTIPFKLGTNSILEVTSQVIGHSIDYSGTGALFQNVDSNNLINRLLISDVSFIGDVANSFINIQSNNRVSLSNVGIGGFGNLGDISATRLIELSQVLGFDYEQGLRLNDALVIICRDLGALNLSANTDPTFISIIDGSTSMKIFLNTIEGTDNDGSGGDSLFFLDPNLGDLSDVVITESFMSSNSNFYQLGTDIVIDSATDAGGGVTTFTTGLAATGTVTCVAPILGDTVTVNGLVYTGVSAPKVNNQTFDISFGATAIAADLADSISNDLRSSITVPSLGQTATSVLGVVTITADVGELGNNIDLASSSVAELAVSGSFLTGGSGVTNNGLSASDIVSLRGFTVPSYNDVFTVISATATSFNVTLTFVSDVAGLMDVSITAAAISGSETRFTTNVPHELQVGKVLVLSNFSETTYNATFVVTAIPTTTTFDVAVTFVSDVSGTLSAASLDQTDPHVTAVINPGQPESQTQVESRNAISPFTVILTTQDQFVRVSETGSESPDDFIQDDATERFSLDTASGIITYTGRHDITVLASYRLNVAKVGGGPNESYQVALFLNDTTQITKTNIPFSALSSAGAGGSYNGGILSLSNLDTITLKVAGSDASPSNVDISDLTILMTET